MLTLFALALPLVAAHLAAQHPGDAGLCDAAPVVFCEMFDGSVADIAARWSGPRNVEAMELAAAPPGAANAQSIQFNAPDGTTGSGLYHSFGDDGLPEHIFMRMYLYYQDGSNNHHSGPRVGWYDPPSQWAQGDAGIKPTGTKERLGGAKGGGMSLGFESVGALSKDEAWFDTYLYHRHMRGNPGSKCSDEEVDGFDSWSDCETGMWQTRAYNCDLPPYPVCSTGIYGNSFSGSDDKARTWELQVNTWTYLEVEIKLNTPGTFDGEMTVWLGTPETPRIVLKKGTPIGFFTWGGWKTTASDPKSEPFEGWEFRVDKELLFNWIFLNHYTTKKTGTFMRYANVVVATERVGPIHTKQQGGQPDQSPQQQGGSEPPSSPTAAATTTVGEPDDASPTPPDGEMMQEANHAADATLSIALAVATLATLS